MGRAPHSERSVLLNDDNLPRNVIVQLRASEGFELLPHIAFTMEPRGAASYPASAAAFTMSCA